MQLQPSKNTHFEKGTTPFWLTPPPLERDIVPFYGIFFFDGFPKHSTYLYYLKLKWREAPKIFRHYYRLTFIGLHKVQLAISQLFASSLFGVWNLDWFRIVWKGCLRLERKRVSLERVLHQHNDNSNTMTSPPPTSWEYYSNNHDYSSTYTITTTTMISSLPLLQCQLQH